MNLYRIMADVSAGAGQPNMTLGNPGIATLWVRANSKALALARAEVILATRQYSSTGRLNSYVEELANDPFGCPTAAERAADRTDESVVAGYDAIKEQALAQADGLHEIWLSGVASQVAREATK